MKQKSAITLAAMLIVAAAVPINIAGRGDDNGAKVEVKVENTSHFDHQISISPDNLKIIEDPVRISPDTSNAIRLHTIEPDKAHHPDSIEESKDDDDLHSSLFSTPGQNLVQWFGQNERTTGLIPGHSVNRVLIPLTETRTSPQVDGIAYSPSTSPPGIHLFTLSRRRLHNSPPPEILKQPLPPDTVELATANSQDFYIMRHPQGTESLPEKQPVSYPGYPLLHPYLFLAYSELDRAGYSIEIVGQTLLLMLNFRGFKTSTCRLGFDSMKKRFTATFRLAHSDLAQEYQEQKMPESLPDGVIGIIPAEIIFRYCQPSNRIHGCWGILHLIEDGVVDFERKLQFLQLR